MATRTPTLPLRLAPGERVDVYVRLSTHDGLHEAVPLTLWESSTYVGHLETETLVYGLYYGALAAILLYNLFLYISTRQRGFGAYTSYLLAFLVWNFTFRGYSLKFLWPDSPNFNNQILAIGACASFFTFGIFMMTYLNTRATLPLKLHRALTWFTWINLISAIPAVLDHYALSFALSIPLGVCLMLGSMVAGGLLWWRGSRPARFYMIAFSLLAVGATLYYLRLAGLMPANAVTEYFLQIGSALEILLLAFGLADQMNMLRFAKLKAEREARAAQKALTNELETLVHQRTLELEAANAQLTEMATVDALTGAHNRRYFNSCFDAAIARCQRHSVQLAFCILDVDNFKLYNDQYGHQAGDMVLKKISVAIKERLGRGGNQFFRLGGEEFGILMDVPEHAGDVPPLVESLRAAVESLAIPHEGNKTGRVTASFGLVILPASDAVIRPEDVYAQADKLLYDAKHAGRNCVICSGA